MNNTTIKKRFTFSILSMIIAMGLIYSFVFVAFSTDERPIDNETQVTIEFSEEDSESVTEVKAKEVIA